MVIRDSSTLVYRLYKESWDYLHNGNIWRHDMETLLNWLLLSGGESTGYQRILSKKGQHVLLAISVLLTWWDNGYHKKKLTFVWIINFECNRAHSWYRMVSGTLKMNLSSFTDFYETETITAYPHRRSHTGNILPPGKLAPQRHLVEYQIACMTR